MLYAKISPAAQVVKQDGPFSSTVKSVEYVVIDAVNYVLGQEQTNFSVRFVTPQYFPNGILSGFQNELSTAVILTATELANWGEDDSIIFPLVGTKLGFTIVEILDSNVSVTTTTSTTQAPGN